MRFLKNHRRGGGAQDLLVKIGEVDPYGRGLLSLEGGGNCSSNALHSAKLSFTMFIFVLTNFGT